MLKFFKLSSGEIPTFILWVIIASLYIRPYNGIMEPFYVSGNYLVFLVTSFRILVQWQNAAFNLKKIYLLLIFSVFFLIFSRIINGYGYDNKYTSNYLYSIALVNLFTFEMQNNPWPKIKGFAALIYVYAVINFITIIMYPSGLYKTEVYEENWYLGFKNVMIRILLPCITLNIISSYYDYGRMQLKDYFLILISFLSVYWVKSDTSIFMMFIFCAMIIWTSIMGYSKIITLLNAFIAVSVMSILFLLFSFQEHFNQYILAFFDKDATFSNRTFVWAFTLGKISESPYLGFGWHSADEWRKVLGFYDCGFESIGFSHPHNFLLYTILQGGIVYLVIIIYLFYWISIEYKSYYSCNIYIILTIMYFVFFIEGLTESLTGAMLFIPMLGLYCTLLKK